ncbi:MAG: phosphomannomutase [Ignavibacteriales bacterium]|nr:MAG: phosphomannomutase [Ignavibacteriaceae bacterium]MBW7872617.1 phosphomannomutase [Ignavibacteria bacterium]MCZ2141829.1 phosphomannomutase [Ignavibacteriales bacterium]OQY77626.1 MAG: phosphomannomutase [Ignavibacteriales bacterium UTCHB3]MBV6444997.1 Phosphomannomutase/phosphoglucomutase [Ignavibacteriaceae bacterium]
MAKIVCFKAYDIRGVVPSELNTELAYNIARGYKKFTGCKSVVIGHDVRKSSPELSQALTNGFLDSGVDVIDIGMCGTEMVYFGTSFLNADGGIMITASHNPPEYNGMKFVREKSIPISYDSGLNTIEEIISGGDFEPLSDTKGNYTKRDISDDFITHLGSFYDVSKIKKMKVVVNAGNGCVGPNLDRLEKILPVEMIKLFNDPDPEFPNGVPNPMLEENRAVTIDAIKKHGAHLGVAWDGDYDRCFFFDESGEFIEGYYIVGMLAKSILRMNPGEKIIHDPRLVWNTIEVCKENGGEAVESKSGHAFIKEKMRAVNAIYGGEMSAHHYFRDNAYSDSGLIPFLLVMQLMSEEDKSLSQLVGEMIAKYPCSGEINSKIADAPSKLEEIKAKYADGKFDFTDGVSVDYGNWRFNLRMSNTEPIIRLNVETKGDIELMKAKTEELLSLIRS